MQRNLFLFAILLSLELSTASAQCSLYVAPGGNDANVGTMASPLASPNIAVSRAPAGSVVCLRGGNYALSVGLYVNRPLTLQSYPGEWAILSGDYSNASPVVNLISIGAPNVTIQDLEMSGGQYYGIYAAEFEPGVLSTNTTIQRVKIHHSGYSGVKAYKADGLKILNSEVYQTGLRIAGGSGLDLLASFPPADNPNGYGLIVRGNYLHDVNYTGVVVKAGTIRGLVENNHLERIYGGGLYMGGDTAPGSFRNKVNYECTQCIVRNNIVVTTDSQGIGCWAATDSVIANNTLIDTARVNQSALFTVPDSLGNVCGNTAIRNNVISNTNGRLAHVVNPGPNLTFDYNFYYTTGTYSMWWQSDAVTGYWSSLSAWQAATGQDAHSLGYQTPLLDAANLYRPTAGSPVIDKGVTLAEVPTDYAGTARPQGNAYDIGAFEFASAAPVPSLLTAVSGGNQTALVNAVYGSALAAKVTDSNGKPISGYHVVFTAPSSGAGATFAGATTASSTTDANGVATSPALTANATSGAFSVTASATSLASVTFSLTNTAPVPSKLTVVSGAGQSAQISTAFAGPLAAKVTDANGNPISGYSVTFTAPASGASATFGASATVTTNASGIATSPALTANGIAGAFTVTVSAASLTPVTFSLTNTPPVPSKLTVVSGAGQSAQVSTAFASPLSAKVIGANGNPIAGYAVTFTAPASGASATFGASATVTTNASGVATSPALTANAIAGSYAITVSAASLTPVAFTLTNTARVVPTTITTVPSGLSFTVDGVTYTAAKTFDWSVGSTHTVAVADSVPGSQGVRAILTAWSDGGAPSHVFTTPAAISTLTASFVKQYQLTTSAGTGGTIDPATSWYNAGTVVTVTAKPASGYLFRGFSGDLTGSSLPRTLTMNAPHTVTASFASTATRPPR